LALEQGLHHHKHLLLAQQTVPVVVESRKAKLSLFLLAAPANAGKPAQELPHIDRSLVACVKAVEQTVGHVAWQPNKHPLEALQVQ